MVIDTSALVAVLQQEPEHGALTRTIRDAPSRRLSAATLVEVGIVMQARYGDVGSRALDALLTRARVEIIPVTAEHAELAREAFRRFGKGQHPAGLNYGDCFAYALAKSLNAPLLYKGGDFARTDVASALA